MNPKINYVIATWDGKDWNETNVMSGRYILDQIGKPRADEILALHLSYLSKLRHSLAQITIMKPKSHNQPRHKDYYTNAEQVLKTHTFACPVVTIESNYYTLYSYGQWLHAYEVYRNDFDYYIMVEDDTVAAIPYFDLLLTTLFQHRIPNQIGYLCSKTFYLRDDYHSMKWDPRLKAINHLAISTGITNSKTLALLFKQYGEPTTNNETGIYDHLQHQMNKYMGIHNHPFSHGNLLQINFSLLFTHNNIGSIGDYSTFFTCPFWSRESGKNKRHTYSEHATTASMIEPLIMPVTMAVDRVDEKSNETTVQKLQLLATLGFLDERVAQKRMELFGMNCDFIELDLSNQNLNNHLLPFAVSKTIRRLNVANNLISDSLMEFLLTIPLERLILDNNQISDDGLAILAKHPTLCYLSIVGNFITSTSILDGHRTLKEINIDVID